MKKVFQILALVVLTGCGTVEYRDRYTALIPEDNQLIDYEVQAPPMTSKAYSVLPWDQQETLWKDYTEGLLTVIGKHKADKAGLRETKSKFQKEIDRLNKEAVKK